MRRKGKRPLKDSQWKGRRTRDRMLSGFLNSRPMIYLCVFNKHVTRVWLVIWTQDIRSLARSVVNRTHIDGIELCLNLCRSAVFESGRNSDEREKWGS